LANPRRITCATRKGRRLVEVGGNEAEGWRMSVERAIRAIESGEQVLYCTIGDQSYLVMVGLDGSGAKFLKTMIDEDEPSCLLQLPDCS
jgi:uncharacterized protein DUF3892